MAGDIELPTAENVSRNFDLIEDASTFIGHLDQGHNPGKMSIMTKVFDARFGWLTGPSRYGGACCRRPSSAATPRSRASSRRRRRLAVASAPA
jgi:hypothetical protein